MGRYLQGFKLDHAGVGKVLKSKDVRAELTRRAEKVLAQAKSTAPVATGYYRDSLELEQDTTDRAVVRIVTLASYGMVIESETGNLARAIDAAGGD